MINEPYPRSLNTIRNRWLAKPNRRIVDDDRKLGMTLPQRLTVISVGVAVLVAWTALRWALTGE